MLLFRNYLDDYCFHWDFDLFGINELDWMRQASLAAPKKVNLELLYQTTLYNADEEPMDHVSIFTPLLILVYIIIVIVVYLGLAFTPRIWEVLYNTIGYYFLNDYIHLYNWLGRKYLKYRAHAYYFDDEYYEPFKVNYIEPFIENLSKCLNWVKGLPTDLYKYFFRKL
jgi:hypothetical protein